MQFIVIGYDGDDAEALDRRIAARQAHLAMSDTAIKKGEQILGVAMLDDAERMTGSVMVVDFPSRGALNAWLEKEPYVTGGVWKKIDVIPCKVGPSFEVLVKTMR